MTTSRFTRSKNLWIKKDLTQQAHCPRQISRSYLKSFLVTLFLLLNYILLRSRIESKSYIQYSNSQENSTKQRQSKLNGGAREPLHPIKAAKIFFSHTIHTESKKKQSQKNELLRNFHPLAHSSGGRQFFPIDAQNSLPLQLPEIKMLPDR